MEQTEPVRPRDPETARRALLGAARDVFARVGFEGARVDEIAAAAGYNKALIFRYFGDKLGLYRAVVGQTKLLVYEQIVRPMLAIANDQDAPLDAARVRRFLAEAVRCSFDFYASHPPCLRMMSWEAAEGWRTFSGMHTTGESVLGNWVEDVCGFVRRAQEAGLIRRDVDPMLLVTNIVNLTLGYHSAIPRFQAMFPSADLASSEALAHAREEITRLIQYGTMTTPERKDDDAARL